MTVSRTRKPSPQGPNIGRKRSHAMFSNLLSNANFAKHGKRESMLRCNMPIGKQTVRYG
jgi:hypothetical protein